jgi:hypothetical protein
MKRGGLAARLSQLEDNGAGECHLCHGRAPHGGCFIQQADGVYRDHTGREMPDGPDEWTCSGCGRTYRRPRVVIQVIGRSTGSPGTTRRGSLRMRD